MIKKLIFLSTLFLSYAYAQVEISNKTKPELDHATDGLYVNFSDKGVLLPRVSLNSLTELKNSSNVNFPTQGDTSQMIVYNTNKAIGEGYHYWDGAKWRPLLDYENIISQLNSSTLYYKEGTGINLAAGASYNVQNPNDPTDPGQNIPAYTYLQSTSMSTTDTTKKFYDIPGVSQKITLNRATNKVSFTFTGIAQVESNYTNLTFGIGVFVDGKLSYIENFSGAFEQLSCGYVNVDLDGVLEGLTVGTEHTIEVKIHPRRANEIYNSSNNNTSSSPLRNRTYYFGTKAGACTNLQDVSMKPKLVVTVKE